MPLPRISSQSSPWPSSPVFRLQPISTSIEGSVNGK